MTRLFFGIDLPLELKELIRTDQQRLKECGIVAEGWSNPNLLHITTLFIGEIDEAYIPEICRAGQLAAATTDAFELAFHSFGVFAQNKVLWIGFDEKSQQFKSLLNISTVLHEFLSDKLPVELDARPYRAHVTLARKLKDATRLRKIFFELTKTFTVTELCLFESKRIHGELVYPVRERFELSKSI